MSGWTESDKQPTCSHCKKVIDDFTDGKIMHDQEATNEECPHCGEEFECEAYVSFSFVTTKKEVIK